jgi:hypothetical protein
MDKIYLSQTDSLHLLDGIEICSRRIALSLIYLPSEVYALLLGWFLVLETFETLAG